MARYQGPQRRRLKRHVIHKCFVVWRRKVLGIRAGRRVESCRIRDLTSRGISFRSVVPPRVGWTLELRFDVPIQVHTLPTDFYVVGRVVWVDRAKNASYYRVACAFKRLTGGAERDLKQFIGDALIDPHLATF